MFRNAYQSLRSRWRSLPTWGKVIVVFIAVGMFGSLVDDGKTDATSTPVKANEKAPVPQKNVGERVFSSSLVAYTESSDGRIIVGFEAWAMKRDSVEGEIKRFMRQLTSERKDGWTSATVSAYGTVTDAYGAKSKKVAYTITFSHDEAMKVVDWNRANIVRIGLREYAIPQLMGD